MDYLEIEKVVGREILDSRGNPTVEAEVHLLDGTVARGAAPSGASTGEFEALELRDGDEKRYGGKGVLQAVGHINDEINDTLKGMDVSDIYAIDRAMMQADGTDDKSHFGANAILATSIACCRAAATSLGIPLYRFLGGVSGRRMPGANDEYCKWWRTCADLRAGCAGVYDHAGRGLLFSRGSALVCRGLSCAGIPFAGKGNDDISWR